MKSTALSVRKSARYWPFGYSVFGLVSKSKWRPSDSIASSKPRLEMAALGFDRLVEAALGRMVVGRTAEVPLPEHRGRVAGLLELVGEGVALERELRDVIDRAKRTSLPVEAVDRADRIGAGTGAVLAGEQGGAGRGAVLAVVVVGEAHALRGEPVDIRGLVILAPEGAEIGPAEVVGQHEDDVGRTVRSEERAEQAGEQQAEQGKDGAHG